MFFRENLLFVIEFPFLGEGGGGVHGNPLKKFTGPVLF